MASGWEVIEVSDRDVTFDENSMIKGKHKLMIGVPRSKWSWSVNLLIRGRTVMSSQMLKKF